MLTKKIIGTKMKKIFLLLFFCISIGFAEDAITAESLITRYIIAPGSKIVGVNDNGYPVVIVSLKDNPNFAFYLDGSRLSKSWLQLVENAYDKRTELTIYCSPFSGWASMGEAQWGGLRSRRISYISTPIIN